MLKISSWLILTALVIFGGASAIRLISNPLNRLTLKEEAGYITEGEKFGIKIGSSVNQVSKVASISGFEFYERAEDNSCLTHEYQDLNVDVYMDDSWRKATLCVASRTSDNVVVAIEWAYGPFKIEL